MTPFSPSAVRPCSVPPSGQFTMLRLRRSRLFLVLAVIAVIALYQFTSFGSLGDGRTSGVEKVKSFASEDSTKDSTSKPTTESTATTDESPASREPLSNGSTTKQGPDDLSETDKDSDTPSPSRTPAATSSESDKESDTSTGKGNKPEPQDQGVDVPKNFRNITKFKGDPAAAAQSPAEPVLGTTPKVHGDGRFEVIAGPDDGMPKIHWSQLPEHFPIPTKSLIPLPTGKPKAIPTIQYSKFPDESSDQKVDREAKLDKIKKAFAFSWEGYRKNAWMQDELSPVTGNYRNPFCGWSATLVDSLDSLWMLGMKKEFEEAAEAVGQIDFTTSIRNDLPLFEVTIRYLGGLVAAYDISGSKYRVLLDKAVELAEVLMGAFDTPNRMPMTFYLWKP